MKRPITVDKLIANLQKSKAKGHIKGTDQIRSGDFEIYAWTPVTDYEIQDGHINLTNYE